MVLSAAPRQGTLRDAVAALRPGAVLICSAVGLIKAAIACSSAGPV